MQIAALKAVATIGILGALVLCPGAAAAKKQSGDAPTQPKKSSLWVGTTSNGRTTIRLKVTQFYGDVAYIAPVLTWPKVKASCWVYNPDTQAFETQQKRITASAAVARSSASQIRGGKFNWQPTYGGEVTLIYKGTFTRNMVKGSLEVPKVTTALGQNCVFGPLKFTLLRQF